MSRMFRLLTDRLILRQWTTSDEDRAYFHYINSDETVMRFFPFRRTRAEADAFLEKLIEQADANGMGWLAICLKSTGAPIGFTGLETVRFDAEFVPATEIGWRLGSEHWGKGYATEAARALLQHGFTTIGLSEIVSFAVPQNTASTAVMKRIGMAHDPEVDFDHPSIPEDYAHLRRHVFYRITAQNWQKQSGQHENHPS